MKLAALRKRLFVIKYYRWFYAGLLAALLTGTKPFAVACSFLRRVVPETLLAVLPYGLLLTYLAILASRGGLGRTPRKPGCEWAGLGFLAGGGILYLISLIRPEWVIFPIYLYLFLGCTGIFSEIICQLLQPNRKGSISP